MFTIGVVTSNRSSFTLLVSAFAALISSLLFGMRYFALIRATAPSPPPRPSPPPPPPPPTRVELSAAAAEARLLSPASEIDTDAEAPVVPIASRPVPSLVQAPDREEMVWVGIVIAGVIGLLIVVNVWGWIPLLTGLLFSYWSKSYPSFIFRPLETDNQG